MEDLIGKTLGQYEIREKIGQGGMAEVFKAYQPGLDRFVAVKVLSPILAREPGFIERFQREALSAARLHHPHILEVYDFGVQNDYSYLVMRYVENSRTLGDLIQEQAPLHTLIDYVIQVADALHFAHERGVIHRDVKPSNILIDGKWAYLADFGLAKVLQASSQLTTTGMGMGTPAYMSPEQASGSRLVDHRTDIYALGVILFRILTGSVPHDAPTPLAILAKRTTEPAPSLRAINPKIPEPLDRVVLRSLATMPDGRFTSASLLAEALKKAEEETSPTWEALGIDDDTQGQTVVVRARDGRPGPAERAVSARPRRRKVGLIAGGALAAVILTGVALFWLLSLVLNRATPQPTVEARATDNRVLSNTVVDTATPTGAPSPALSRIPSALAKVDLDVRSGPGDEYDLLGYLPEGAEAEIVSRDQSRQWWQINTRLAAGGVGWIKSAAEFSEAKNTENLPIALAPPTPTKLASTADAPALFPTATPAPATPTMTATPLPEAPTSTAVPTPTFTPSLAPTSTSTAVVDEPTATRAPAAPAGQLSLLMPTSLEQPTYGPTEFEWQWDAPVPADQGFEVRVWREGEPPAGVHNAVEDNRNGKVVALGNNTYRLSVDITDAAGVRGRSGEYLWTVVLVQIIPEYQDLGKQAAPARLRFEAPGGGGGDDGGGKPTF